MSLRNPLTRATREASQTEDCADGTWRASAIRKGFTPATCKDARHSLSDIGQVARHLGISAGSLRHYEQKGLLPGVSRTAAGYRVYTARDIKQIKRILAARAMGFSLKHIAHWMKSSCRCARLASMQNIAAARQHEIYREIVRLNRSARNLRRLLFAIQSEIARGDQ